MKINFKNSVLPGLIMIATLIPATIAINWHLAELDPTRYYTVTLTHSLSINCLPYYLFALLGFAFSHTENGKRIIVPVNLTAVAMLTTWIATYFWLAPTETWSIATLTKTIDTQLILLFLIGSIPFVHFYLTSSKIHKQELSSIKIKNNS